MSKCSFCKLGSHPSALDYLLKIVFSGSRYPSVSTCLQGCWRHVDAQGCAHAGRSMCVQVRTCTCICLSEGCWQFVLKSRIHANRCQGAHRWVHSHTLNLCGKHHPDGEPAQHPSHVTLQTAASRAATHSLTKDVGEFCLFLEFGGSWRDGEMIWGRRDGISL